LLLLRIFEAEFTSERKGHTTPTLIHLLKINVTFELISGRLLSLILSYVEDRGTKQAGEPLMEINMTK